MEQREPDDTTKRGEPPTRDRDAGGYYYDDATGYEIYTPDEDDEEGLDELKTETRGHDGGTDSEHS